MIVKYSVQGFLADDSEELKFFDLYSEALRYFLFRYVDDLGCENGHFLIHFYDDSNKPLFSYEFTDLASFCYGYGYEEAFNNYM